MFAPNKQKKYKQRKIHKRCLIEEEKGVLSSLQEREALFSIKSECLKDQMMFRFKPVHYLSHFLLEDP
jgi:hypothetical protein